MTRTPSRNFRVPDEEYDGWRRAAEEWARREKVPGGEQLTRFVRTAVAWFIEEKRLTQPRKAGED
jgi:hypothetical protein